MVEKGHVTTENCTGRVWQKRGGEGVQGIKDDDGKIIMRWNGYNDYNREGHGARGFV